MIKIILDAGHGENTSGKRSPDGSLREYKYCRELATLVKEKLLNEGFQVYYTCENREDDIKPKERCAIINNICKKEGAKNCILLSLHNDAVGVGTQWFNARGWSVRVALNASDNSKRLAQCLLGEAIKANIMGNRSIPKEGYWAQDLYICRDTNCPAVLIENLFMDNKEDVQFLLSLEGREILSNVIVEGIKNYINK